MLDERKNKDKFEIPSLFDNAFNHPNKAQRDKWKTAIEKEQIDLSAWLNKKMFHVEQGRLTDLI